MSASSRASRRSAQALAQTERERFVAQALSRLSAEATAQQRREVEQLAGALFDEQQALQARQRLLDEGRSVIDRTRTATEQHAAEIAKLNELLAAGAIDQATYARAVEDANDRALRSSQAWTDGATRFLKDYVAESNDAATATERAFANAFSWCRGLAGRLHQLPASWSSRVSPTASSPTSRARRCARPSRPRSPVLCRARSPAAACSACSTRAASPASGRPRCAMPMPRCSSTRRATTAAASPAPASCRTRSRSSPGAGSWWCRPSGSCARRRRHASSGRSPWWSTSPPLTRAPFVRARARSRPTWRARSIGRAGTDSVTASEAYREGLEVAVQRVREWARAVKRDVLVVYLVARDSRVPLAGEGAGCSGSSLRLSPIDTDPDFIPVLQLASTIW